MTYVPASDRYDPMRYRRCGRSGLKLPAISLGLWQNFGDDRAARDAARDRAPRVRPRHHALRPGEQLRPALRLRRARRSAGSWPTTCAPTATSSSSRRRPATTCGPGPYGDWGSRKYLLASLDQSLERMGLDYVDIFYSHRVDPDTPLEETMGALDTAVRQGKALYAGISSYSAAAHRRGGRGSCATSARRCSSTSRRTRCSTAGSRRACSTCSATRASACIVVLAARAGHAHRPSTSTASRRTRAPRPRRLALARPAHRRGARARPRAERDRAGARAVARADGARVDAARPARDLDARSARAASRQLEENLGALEQPRRSPTTSSPTIDGHAVDGGINLWAASSAH